MFIIRFIDAFVLVGLDLLSTLSVIPHFPEGDRVYVRRSWSTFSLPPEIIRIPFFTSVLSWDCPEFTASAMGLAISFRFGYRLSGSGLPRRHLAFATTGVSQGVHDNWPWLRSFCKLSIHPQQPSALFPPRV